MAPHTPESINESIAHQSTLNVEVPEFRPKIVLQPTTNGFARHNNKKTPYNKHETRHDEASRIKKQIKSNSATASKLLTDKKLQASSVPVVNGDSNNVNNSNTTKTNASTANIKKRQTNPVLDKKFLIESTKNIEMQNIDLMKTKSETLSRKDDVKIETTWVVVGGKRKMIQEEIPIEREKKVIVEQETTPVVNGTDSTSNDIVNDSSLATNHTQTKKPSRKAKQKNKTQNKRNATQGKSTKLQGFVIEEPTFAPVVEPQPELESDIEAVDSDAEELLEAALIEEIPWTDADVAEVTKATSDDFNEKLSDLSEASSTSASIIIVNTNNNETEQEKADIDEKVTSLAKKCDEEKNNQGELDQIKADEHILILPEMEIINETEEADTSCSSQNNPSLVVEEIVLNGTCPDNPTDFEEIPTQEKEVVEEVQTKIVAGKNGLSKHLTVEPETKCDAIEEIICEKVTTEVVQSSPIVIEDVTNDEAAILEVNGHEKSEKYFLTAAVCNWLHTFNNNDLQSLFTIPLNADFVKKIKYCSEISQYFADDELQNLDKFINENFCKYQHLSASSSLSSLLSDMSSSDDDEDDTEPTSEHTQQAIRSTKATKKALKIFGCEIM